MVIWDTSKNWGEEKENKFFVKNNNQYFGPQELWELFKKKLKIQKKIEINFLKNFRIFHKVKIVNININMVISRRVNANASPDVPKPLYQWGGCASPLIQSFGCTDSARALRRTGCTHIYVPYTFTCLIL